MKTLQNTVQKFTKGFFHKKNNEKNMTNTVEPKRYTKSQLAALYNRPVKTLMRWIHSDKELMEELKELGYREKSRIEPKMDVIPSLINLALGIQSGAPHGRQPVGRIRGTQSSKIDGRGATGKVVLDVA